MSDPHLARRRLWVFDMDGTLTVAVHDFASMKRRLGFPEDGPLLESIEALPPEARRAAWEAVAAWEWALADEARAAPGVGSLLDHLVGQGCALAVLTRNRRDIALRTLEVAGLRDRLDDAWILGREDAAPKPAPDGVLRLLALSGRAPGEAVMVGDHDHDLHAGRAAGTATVLLSTDPGPRDRAAADRVFATAADLHASLAAAPTRVGRAG